MKLRIMFVGWIELWTCISEDHVRFLSLLCRSASWCVLTWLALESALSVNKRVEDNFISFLESLGSPLFDAYNSSYG